MELNSVVPMSRKTSTFLLLAAGSAVAVHLSYKWLSSRYRGTNRKWEEVGTVSQLLIHPVKSAGGIEVDSADATANGLASDLLVDRSFIVICGGIMVTGRDTPYLLTLRTSVQGSVLTITDRLEESVKIDTDAVNSRKQLVKFRIRDTDVEGYDCGDEASEWISRILYDTSREARLIYKGNHDWVRPPRRFPYKLANVQPRDTPLYADSSVCMVMTQSSIDDLNTKLTRPVDVSYFRPPIVVAGTVPYDEDTWEYIKIGDSVVLRAFKPCERCLLTEFVPETAEKRTDHTDIMRTYRLVTWPLDMAQAWKTKPILGVQCGIDVTGRIQTGDRVFVTRHNPRQWHIGN